MRRRGDLVDKAGWDGDFLLDGHVVQRRGARRGRPGRRCDHAGRQRLRPWPRRVRAGPAAYHARGPEPVRKAGDRMTGKLNLDPAVVARARELARRAGQPVVELARTHTTVSVERAVLRLAGLDGAD